MRRRAILHAAAALAAAPLMTCLLSRLRLFMATSLEEHHAPQ
jgi:hypothetical protein